MEKHRVFGLDLMRATAILMVLCSHVLWIYPPGSGFVTQIFSLFGFWGVEVFFVLSGFLIGKIVFRLYQEENFGFRSVVYFLKRRWFRTLPNYYLILMVNLLIALYIGTDLSDFAHYVVFMQNFFWPMKPFFTESWSLSVEEFTYLLLPLMLWLTAKAFRKVQKSVRFISVVIVLLASFFVFKLGYYFTTENTNINQWNLSLKSVVVYRIDAVLYGVLGAWISLKYPRFWKKNRVRSAFLGIGLMGILYVGPGYFHYLIDSQPFFWNVLYLPLSSMVFLLFLPFLSQWTKSIRLLSAPVTFVSKVSYSVYLLHYGVVLQLMKYFFDTSAYSVVQLHWFTVIYLIITFLLSFLLYNYYEQPIMNLRDKPLSCQFPKFRARFFTIRQNILRKL